MARNKSTYKNQTTVSEKSPSFSIIIPIENDTRHISFLEKSLSELKDNIKMSTEFVLVTNKVDAEISKSVSNISDHYKSDKYIFIKSYDFSSSASNHALFFKGLSLSSFESVILFDFKKPFTKPSRPSIYPRVT